jgi:hypothetical protein
LACFGHATWPLTLREEHGRLRVLKNRVLMKILGPKREEVTGDWTKLQNEECQIFTAHQILLE